MKNITITILTTVCFLFTSCTSDKDFRTGKRRLENQGYTNIKNTGYNMFCCSEDDNFSTGFTATDKNGYSAKGCFCSGVGKGVTIRFDN